MNEQSNLTYMANLYMALADKTRLRLLNLMRDKEICVGYFTDVLGDSQPKVSRHLAYLRNADIVEARRDGKWMHYRIKWPEDRDLADMIAATLRSIRRQSDCLRDSEKYAELFGGDGVPAAKTSENIDIYAETYISDSSFTREEMPSSSHNELEEFLL
jgi:ArsR family transcriptional regulator